MRQTSGPGRRKDRRPNVLESETLSYFQAIQKRKHHVEHDDVERRDLGGLQPCGPVKTNLNDGAFLFESFANVFRQFPIVFHQENTRAQVPLD